MTILVIPALVLGLSVEIQSPTEGDVVSGTITVRGVSNGVGNGRVSVSIDGGDFELAEGTDPWTFSWDTTTVANGLHTITARARTRPGGDTAFDSIVVDVQNGTVLGIRIEEPEDGDVVLDTLVVFGTSTNAESVSLQVDDGEPLPANGLDPWTVVFEPGSLSPGLHTLTARATNGQDIAEDSVEIEVADPIPGLQEFTYLSSVDGVPMISKLWVPVGFDPGGGETALVIHLHGGGGRGNISSTMASELDARGWIGIAPDGREWGLADKGCPWQTSAAYLNSPNPAVGPGEQDIFDAIDWTVENFPIDTDRIYLTGFSMGGRGTYMIGLKNPDRFAAIAPMGPAIDMLEVFDRRPEPRECKEGMVGGQPGDSPFVDTMYKISSGRFLIENAYNLPVYHGHGLQDTVANNDPDHAPFLHGWHITSDDSWDGCHGNTDLCFGHTPILEELQVRHPHGYDWAFMFSGVGHSTDPKWLQGSAIEPGIFGIEDPQNPGFFLGIYDFFERRTLVHSPQTIVYKTFTDEHRRAYWLELDSATAGEDRPAAVRVSRDIAMNSLDIELVRAARLTVDLPRAGLALSAGSPLIVDLRELVEETFDPALAASGEVLEPELVFEGDFVGLNTLVIFRDGIPLDPKDYQWDDGSIHVSSMTLEDATTLILFGSVFFSPLYGWK